MKDIEQSENAEIRTPNRTAKGEERAWVSLQQLETLWVNTGTLCNIECVNCYIESSPTNDQLVYFKERIYAPIWMKSPIIICLSLKSGSRVANPL